MTKELEVAFNPKNLSTPAMLSNLKTIEAFLKSLKRG